MNFTNLWWCLIWGKHQQQFSSCLHTQAVPPAPDPVAAQRDAEQTPAEAALFPGHAALFHFHPPSTSTSLTLGSSHVHMKAAVKYTFVENPGARMEIQTVSLLILLSVWLKICTFFLLVLCVNAFYITAASFTTPDLCWPQFRWELKYRRTLTRVSEMLCLAITIKMQK